MLKLKDNYDRIFSYLRLSITDACNFNCNYCLPNIRSLKKSNALSIDEIKNLISAFSYLGLTKVRLTGGEPTLRKDFTDIGKIISSFSGITSLVFTTNGYKLYSLAKDLKASGFTGVNISLDSLCRSKFFIITNRMYFDKVVCGIFEALNYGLNVKLNVVLSNFFSFFDFENFYSILRYKNLTIRFIDQMETNSIKKDVNFISSFYLISFLKRNGWFLSSNIDKTSGPAVIFEHENFLGKIGFINPYSNSFCKSCNRLRVSSNGELFLCLFGGVSYSLKNFLFSDRNKYELVDFIIDKIKLKHESHFLHNNNYGVINSFSSIGG